MSVVLGQGDYETTMDGEHGVDDGEDDDGAPLAATGEVYGLPSGRLKK